MLSPEPEASVILSRFVARGDFTDLMGRAAMVVRVPTRTLPSKSRTIARDEVAGFFVA